MKTDRLEVEGGMMERRKDRRMTYSAVFLSEFLP